MGLEPHLAAWQTLVLQKLLHLLPRSVCMTDVFFLGRAASSQHKQHSD